MNAPRSSPDLGLALRPHVRVGRAEPTFVDLRIPSPALHLMVTGPGMLVERLRLVTDLGVLDGMSHPGLDALAGKLEAVSLCGTTGPQPVEITVTTNRLGASLEIDAGPMSMYETELVVRTRSGQPLDAVLSETIAVKRQSSFVAGLVPVAGSGHHEHHAEAGRHFGQSHERHEVDDAGTLELAGGDDHLQDDGHHHEGGHES